MIRGRIGFAAALLMPLSAHAVDELTKKPWEITREEQTVIREERMEKWRDYDAAEEAEHADQERRHEALKESLEGRHAKREAMRDRVEKERDGRAARREEQRDRRREKEDLETPSAGSLKNDKPGDW